MRNEIAAIERLLKSDKLKVKRNKTWDSICVETGAGAVVGKEIHFASADKQRLRAYIASACGVDPQFDSRSGGRMAMASHDASEKLTSDSVFGHLVVIATAGKSEIKVNGDTIKTPAGSVLSVLPENLDREHLKTQKLVIVENGAIMPYWHEIQLPGNWKDSVIIYRGHRENMRTVAEIARIQPDEQLGWFFDFDPAGLALGFDQGKGVLMIPEAWSSFDSKTGFNQPHKYHDQKNALNRIKKQATGELHAIVAHMEKHSLAVMQEHLVQRRVALIERKIMDGFLI
ncbi:MAG: hypothetical protein IBX50_17225 [Marinospirillum sp.]|uniref:DUF7281 domain-containing protein n=1 Tax=Marinospirillum sp. TaxID=2183934 RepID=UPI0019DCE8CB|nr:hypothetical protein [Marinospirillum sp.]MBE0508433.1 hypothetical protein [Marinospirillum sp.]